MTVASFRLRKSIHSLGAALCLLGLILSVAAIVLGGYPSYFPFWVLIIGAIVLMSSRSVSEEQVLRVPVFAGLVALVLAGLAAPFVRWTETRELTMFVAFDTPTSRCVSLSAPTVAQEVLCSEALVTRLRRNQTSEIHVTYMIVRTPFERLGHDIAAIDGDRHWRKRWGIGDVK